MSPGEPGAPARHPDVVARPLGEELLIGRELTGRTVVLDPVAAVLWGSLDGQVATDELVADLVDSLGGSSDQRRAEVDGFLAALASLGFLAGPLPPGVLPRRLHPTPDPTSCLGKRLGLERATIHQIGTGDDAFRFGTTMKGLAEGIARSLGAVEPDARLRETFVARISPGRGRVGRTQQLFDALGNVLYAGRDQATCQEALCRTLSARSVLRDGGIWTEGASLLSDHGVVLLHPAIGHEAVGPLRRELQARHVGFVPSAFLRLDGTDSVVLPQDVVTGRPAEELPLLAVVVPADPDRRSVPRFVLSIARCWDDRHLDAFLDLADTPRVVELPQGLTVVEIVERLAGAAGSGPEVGSSSRR